MTAKTKKKYRKKKNIRIACCARKDTRFVITLKINANKTCLVGSTAAFDSIEYFENHFTLKGR